MGSFRKFMEDENIPFGMTSISPTPPDEAGAETHDDSTVTDKEFDISKDARLAADSSMTYTLEAPLTLPNGVQVFAGTQVGIEPLDNGNYKFRVLATNSRKMRDMDGNDWNGELRDSDTEMEVTKKWVEKNLKSPAFKALSGGTPPMAPGGLF